MVENVSLARAGEGGRRREVHPGEVVPSGRGGAGGGVPAEEGGLGFTRREAVTEFPDGTDRLYADPADGHAYRSIGWLGRSVPSIGATDPRVLERLRILKITNSVDDHELGLHVCGLCGRYQDRGQFFVQGHGVRYLMPNMVDHYIVAHRYRLPDDAVAAVMSATLPERNDHLSERTVAARAGWKLIEINADAAIARREREDAIAAEDLAFVLGMPIIEIDDAPDSDISTT
jgi:hypothetical protein